MDPSLSYLTEDATKTIIRALVTSHLDYCNAVLYGLPASDTLLYWLSGENQRRYGGRHVLILVGEVRMGNIRYGGRHVVLLVGEVRMGNIRYGGGRHVFLLVVR